MPPKSAFPPPPGGTKRKDPEPGAAADDDETPEKRAKREKANRLSRQAAGVVAVVKIEGESSSSSPPLPVVKLEAKGEEGKGEPDAPPLPLHFDPKGNASTRTPLATLDTVAKNWKEVPSSSSALSLRIADRIPAMHEYIRRKMGSGDDDDAHYAKFIADGTPYLDQMWRLRKTPDQLVVKNAEHKRAWDAQLKAIEVEYNTERFDDRIATEFCGAVQKKLKRDIADLHTEMKEALVVIRRRIVIEYYLMGKGEAKGTEARIEEDALRINGRLMYTPSESKGIKAPGVVVHERVKSGLEGLIKVARSKGDLVQGIKTLLGSRFGRYTTTKKSDLARLSEHLLAYGAAWNRWCIWKRLEARVKRVSDGTTKLGHVDLEADVVVISRIIRMEIEDMKRAGFNSPRAKQTKLGRLLACDNAMIGRTAIESDTLRDLAEEYLVKKKVAEYSETKKGQAENAWIVFNDRRSDQKTVAALGSAYARIRNVVLVGKKAEYSVTHSNFCVGWWKKFTSAETQDLLRKAATLWKLAHQHGQATFGTLEHFPFAWVATDDRGVVRFSGNSLKSHGQHYAFPKKKVKYTKRELTSDHRENMGIATTKEMRNKEVVEEIIASLRASRGSIRACGHVGWVRIDDIAMSDTVPDIERPMSKNFIFIFEARRDRGMGGIADFFTFHLDSGDYERFMDVVVNGRPGEEQPIHEVTEPSTADEYPDVFVFILEKLRAQRKFPDLPIRTLADPTDPAIPYPEYDARMLMHHEVALNLKGGGNGEEEETDIQAVIRARTVTMAWLNNHAAPAMSAIEEATAGIDKVSVERKVSRRRPVRAHTLAYVEQNVIGYLQDYAEDDATKKVERERVKSQLESLEEWRKVCRELVRTPLLRELPEQFTESDIRNRMTTVSIFVTELMTFHESMYRQGRLGDAKRNTDSNVVGINPGQVIRESWSERLLLDSLLEHLVEITKPKEGDVKLMIQRGDDDDDDEKGDDDSPREKLADFLVVWFPEVVIEAVRHNNPTVTSLEPKALRRWLLGHAGLPGDHPTKRIADLCGFVLIAQLRVIADDLQRFQNLLWNTAHTGLRELAQSLAKTSVIVPCSGIKLGINVPNPTGLAEIPASAAREALANIVSGGGDDQPPERARRRRVWQRFADENGVVPLALLVPGIPVGDDESMDGLEKLAPFKRVLSATLASSSPSKARPVFRVMFVCHDADVKNATTRAQATTLPLFNFIRTFKSLRDCDVQHNVHACNFYPQTPYQQEKMEIKWRKAAENADLRIMVCSRQNLIDFRHVRTGAVADVFWVNLAVILGSGDMRGSLPVHTFAVAYQDPVPMPPGSNPELYSALLDLLSFSNPADFAVRACEQYFRDYLVKNAQSFMEAVLNELTHVVGVVPMPEGIPPEYSVATGPERYGLGRYRYFVDETAAAAAAAEAVANLDKLDWDLVQERLPANINWRDWKTAMTKVTVHDTIAKQVDSKGMEEKDDDDDEGEEEDDDVVEMRPNWDMGTRYEKFIEMRAADIKPLSTGNRKISIAVDQHELVKPLLEKVDTLKIEAEETIQHLREIRANDIKAKAELDSARLEARVLLKILDKRSTRSEGKAEEVEILNDDEELDRSDNDDGGEREDIVSDDGDEDKDEVGKEYTNKETEGAKYSDDFGRKVPYIGPGEPEERAKMEERAAKKRERDEKAEKEREVKEKEEKKKRRLRTTSGKEITFRNWYGGTGKLLEGPAKDRGEIAFEYWASNGPPSTLGLTMEAMRPRYKKWHTRQKEKGTKYDDSKDYAPRLDRMMVIMEQENPTRSVAAPSFSSSPLTSLTSPAAPPSK